MWNFNLLGLVNLLPAVLATLWLRHQANAQRKSRIYPFDELERRPAGEALRLKIETLDEKLADQIFLLMSFPTGSVMFTLIEHSSNPTFVLTLLTISTIWSIIFIQKIHKLHQEKANYILGYDGERFVGEKLSRLIALGFHIYHDVPFDNYNADHVLVGTRGVFSIETKTRSKPKNDEGKKQYHVLFDGQTLEWPNWQESESIEQTKNIAKGLSIWLNSATGEKVRATPILTIPGWMVDRKAPNVGLHVLNPKEIYHVCASFPETLTPAQVQRLCHQLNQKCRIAVD